MTNIITRARAIRERSGFGMDEARKAVAIADSQYDGDDLLGMLWVHANGFAINVKGDRAAWNDEWARSAAPRWPAA